MEFGLKGKVAVVTGAASEHGIGQASALALAAEGADLAVVDIDFDDWTLTSEDQATSACGNNVSIRQ